MFAVFERVKNIILTPTVEARPLMEEEVDIRGIFSNYLLYVAALPALGLILSFGSYYGFFFRMRYALVSYAALLATFYIGAKIIEQLSSRFDAVPNFENSLKMLAYAATPFMVGGLFQFLGGLGSLLLLAGVVYSLYLFYTGLPVFMATPSERVIPFLAVAVALNVVVYMVLLWVLLPIFGLRMVSW